MQTLKLIRDCPATLIPAGDTMILAAGTELDVTQALGGSVTVRTGLGLFRIEPANLDALGPEAAERYRLKADGTSGAGPVTEERVWEALRGCFDPEIPVNIVDLGLIYDLRLDAGPRGGKRVDVRMTLTAPGCGMGPSIARDAKTRIEAIAGVDEAVVEIVWDPQWTPHMISPAGRQQMGIE